jgi:hypothetical protein
MVAKLCSFTALQKRKEIPSKDQKKKRRKRKRRKTAAYPIQKMQLDNIFFSNCNAFKE